MPDRTRAVSRRLRSLAPGRCSSRQIGVRAPSSRQRPARCVSVPRGTPGTYLVPCLVRQFVSQRPFVDVDFRPGTSAETLTALRNHEVEIAVIGGLASHEELTVEPLFDDQIVLVGAPALAHTRLWPRDLDRLLWVHREEGSATRVALEAALHVIGAVPRWRWALPSWEAIKLVVAEGDAVAAISRLAITVEQQAGTLTGAHPQRLASRSPDQPGIASSSFHSAPSPPPLSTCSARPAGRRMASGRRPRSDHPCRCRPSSAV